LNIEQIYNQHLRDKNAIVKANREEGNHFHASSSGSCFRQQLYYINGYEPEEFDDPTIRRFEMGHSIHNSIQDALAKAEDNGRIKEILYIEENIELPEFNLVGRLDIATIDTDTNTLSVYDIKTAAAYTWTLNFGHLKNRASNPNPHYKLQLGIYTHAMMKRFKPDKVNMFLVWYRKNDSFWREQPIPIEWIEKSIEYWTEMLEIYEELGTDVDALEPEVTPGVPMEEWQCKTCNFKNICPSKIPTRKTKRRG